MKSRADPSRQRGHVQILRELRRTENSSLVRYCPCVWGDTADPTRRVLQGPCT